MFGIKQVIENLYDICKTDRDWIISVQSTNDKRYNEICNEISLIKTVQEKHHTDIGVLQKDMQSKPYMNDLVKCDTCKCLLYKDDAIKGESRIVKASDYYFNGRYYFVSSWGKETKEEPFEKIKEVYYCHKCKPAQAKEDKCQKKPLKSEGKSKQTKTTKSDKKSQSKVK